MCTYRTAGSRLVCLCARFRLLRALPRSLCECALMHCTSTAVHTLNICSFHVTSFSKKKKILTSVLNRFHSLPLASRQLPTPSLLQEGRGEEADWTLMRQDQVEIVFLDNRNLILPDSPEKRGQSACCGTC